MRILALILIICILGSNALASSNACVNLFLSPLATTNTALRQQKTEYDILNRYINSLSLMPQIKGRQHPRVRANQDLNQLGIFQREIEKQFPIINEVIQAYFKLQQNLESVTFE